MTDSLYKRWYDNRMPEASVRKQITFLCAMIEKGYDPKRVVSLATEYLVPLSRRYIQFALPSGAAGNAPAWYSMIIRKYLTKNGITEYNVTYDQDSYKMNIWPQNENDVDRIYELIRKETWFQTPKLKELYA